MSSKKSQKNIIILNESSSCYLGRTFFLFFLSFFAFCFLPSSASAFQKPPNNLGLVGYWSLDDNAGTVATDFSGRGNSGTLVSSPTWVAGKRGRALSFNGTSDYVVANPISGMPDIGGLMTISLWVKYPSVASRRIAFTLAQNDGASPNAVDIELTSADPTKIGAVQSGAGTIVSATAPSVNVWHHIAYVQTGSGVILYIDGAQANTGSNPVQSGAVGVMRIGSFNTTFPTPYWSGQVDEVRVYNRALTPSEVSALYGAGSAKLTTPSSTGLVGYWPMDDATSTIVSDLSGGGNNGTMSSFSNPSTGTSGWGNGKRGKALVFDGANDRVSLGQNKINTQLQGASGVTISTWIKYDTLTSGQDDNTIFTHGINIGANGSYLNLRGDAGSEGKINAIFRSGAGDTLQRKSSAIQLVAGRWYHVVSVADFPNDLSYIYIDGVLSGGAQATTFTNNTYVGGTASVGTDSIGTDLDGIAPFDGTIDDVRIYKRALSAAEIASLYRSGQVATNASQNSKLTNGLVGLWSFNGQDVDWSTGKVFDRSGSSFHGDVVGLSTTTSITFGNVGQAMFFNGTTDYVKMGNVLAFERTNPFSVSVWAKRNILGINQRFLGKMKNSAGNRGWVLQFGSTNKVSLALNNTSGTNSLVVDTTSTFTDTIDWHHYVVTYDGSSSPSGVFIYVDGVRQGTSASFNSLSATMVDASISFQIGARDGAGSPFIGSLDEVRVYNRTLSSVEAKQLYNMGR